MSKFKKSLHAALTLPVDHPKRVEQIYAALDEVDEDATLLVALSDVEEAISSLLLKAGVDPEEVVNDRETSEHAFLAVLEWARLQKGPVTPSPQPTARKKATKRSKT